jgi:hypothetical protein
MTRTLTDVIDLVSQAFCGLRLRPLGMGTLQGTSPGL